MYKYGLYCRKSKKEDGDSVKSIEDQKAYWVERSDQHGYVIKKEYEENKTAKIPDVRPVYREMINDLRSGKINAVLVWHINRLARNPKEAGEFSQLLIDGVIQEVRA